MPKRRQRVGVGLTLLGGVAAALAVAASGRFGRRASASASMAANVCYECHIDFRAEELVVAHEKHGVTCVRCHGASQPHMDDEARRTPADATFRGKAGDVFCLTCHGSSRQHAAEVAKMDPPRACTRCHGKHCLVRTPPPRKG